MKKIKIITAICSFLLVQVIMSADNVPYEMAENVARHFFGMSCETRSSADNVYLICTSDDTTTKSTAGTSFYVFGRQEGSGFVIISGEDSVAPILGYSLEGTYNEKQLPVNLEWWLEELKTEILEMRQTGPKASSEVTKQWELFLSGSTLKTKSSSSVLLETAKWNQDDPYNKKCPNLNGQKAYAGCVTASLAIMMRYYKWPKKGSGYLDSYEFTDDNGITRTVKGHSIDDHYYNWNNMPLIFEDYTQEQEDEIVQLMWDLAVMLKMQFNKDGSGGYLMDGLIGLIDHMQYDTGMSLYGRSMFDAKEWRRMIIECLDNGDPVWYSGSSNTSGHAFVIDGYDEYGLFHINWGWGGSHDGYFSMPNLLSYRYEHEACFGLKKYEGNTPVDMMAFGYVSNGLEVVDDVKVEQGIPFTVRYDGIYNMGLSEYNGEVALMTIDRSGNIKEYLKNAITIKNLKPNYGWSSERIIEDCTITLPIEIGDRLKLFYSSGSGPEKEWKPVMSFYGNAVDEIPIADSYYIEEVTDFEYLDEEETAILHTKPDASVTLFDVGKNELCDNFTFENGEIRIFMADLEEGLYRLRIEKGTDVKILELKK